MSFGQETARCPHCRETIALEAKKCKHCGSEIKPKLSGIQAWKKRNDTFRLGFLSGFLLGLILALLLYLNQYADI